MGVFYNIFTTVENWCYLREIKKQNVDTVKTFRLIKGHKQLLLPTPFSSRQFHKN